MSSDNAERMFLETKPGHLFFKAAIPGALGMLASSLYYLLEGILVGRVLGAEPFAALNLAMPFVIINFAVSDMIGVGSSVPIAIKLGRGEKEEANVIFSTAVTLIVISGIVTGTLLFVSAPFLFRLMGADDHLIPLAVKYLRMYACFSPLTTMVFAVDNYLRICGKIKGSLMMNICMAAAGVIFEVFFLIILKGDIASAALGTCLGMSSAVLVTLSFFARGKMNLRFRVPKFHFSLIKTIVSCGLPTFLSNISGRIVSIIMNTLLLSLGGADAVSVYGIIMSADGVIMPLMYGTCDSLQPSVGYNWGARRFDRVGQIEKYCFGAGAVLSLLFGIFIFTFPDFAVSLFIEGGNSNIHTLGVAALRIASFAFIIRWIFVCTQCFMSAIEKPVYAAAISVSAAFIFPIILIMAFSSLGLTGIWMNLPVTSLLTAILALVILTRYKGIVRKEKESKSFSDSY